METDHFSLPASFSGPVRLPPLRSSPGLLQLPLRRQSPGSGRADGELVPVRTPLRKPPVRLDPSSDRSRQGVSHSSLAAGHPRLAVPVMVQHSARPVLRLSSSAPQLHPSTHSPQQEATPRALVSLEPAPASVSNAHSLIRSQFVQTAWLDPLKWQPMHEAPLSTSPEVSSAASLLAASRQDNTMRTYRGHLRRAQAAGLPVLASPEDIVIHLGRCFTQHVPPLAPSTVRSSVAAISAFHSDAYPNLPVLATHPLVSRALDGYMAKYKLWKFNSSSTAIGSGPLPTVSAGTTAGLASQAPVSVSAASAPGATSLPLDP